MNRPSVFLSFCLVAVGIALGGGALVASFALAVLTALADPSAVAAPNSKQPTAPFVAPAPDGQPLVEPITPGPGPAPPGPWPEPPQPDFQPPQPWQRFD